VASPRKRKSPRQRTKTVQIPVVIDEQGRWMAGGTCFDSDRDESHADLLDDFDRVARMEGEAASNNRFVAWVEVKIPIPHNKKLRGRVVGKPKKL
jgi:hypothetical protein